MESVVIGAGGLLSFSGVAAKPVEARTFRFKLPLRFRMLLGNIEVGTSSSDSNKGWWDKGCKCHEFRFGKLQFWFLFLPYQGDFEAGSDRKWEFYPLVWEVKMQEHPQ